MRYIDENKITVAHDFLDKLDDPRTKDVDWWCNKLNNIMKTEMDAAVAILGYSLPFPSNMLGCPLGMMSLKGWEPQFHAMNMRLQLLRKQA